MRFLGRAKKFLQDLGTDSGVKTQSFNVLCASGHRVRGERTEGYQALRCPACGEGVFVLPRSPLPDPVAPAGAVRRRSTGRGANARVDEGPVELTDPAHGSLQVDDGGLGGAAEIVWDDEPGGPGPPSDAPRSPRLAPEDLAAEEIDAARRSEAAARQSRETQRAAARRAGPEDAPSARTRRDGGEPAAETPPGREAPASPGSTRSGRPRHRPAETLSTGDGPATVAVRARTRRGPHLGLIFVLLTLLVVGTVAWRVWRQRRAQYPQVAERGRTEGIPALESGDFDRANQLLSAARSAVDALGGAIDGADEIRQAAREAAIFNDRCPEPLEDLLAKPGRQDPETWQTQFDTLYKGRFYVFDTLIRSAPARGQNGAYQIEYRVFPRGEASRFNDGALARPDRYAEIDLTGFDLFDGTGLGEGGRATFGARLQSITYDSERNIWMVRLESRDAAFITHQRALQAIGWPELQTVELPEENPQ